MKKKALLLMLFIMFISTNALAQNVIWGYVTGDKIKDVHVDVSKFSCGVIQDYAVTTTNSLGQYGIGDLEAGKYMVVPEANGLDFAPMFRWVDIMSADDEVGNVNFISSYSPLPCDDVCKHEFDYCMDHALSAYMSCLIVGDFNFCWANLILEEDNCEITKECCQDACPYECITTEG